jgi:hypothetical protein
MPDDPILEAFIERLRRRRERADGRIIFHDLDDLDPFDPADHDDEPDTDHLARLADPEVLARVLEIAAQPGNHDRYGPPFGGRD